MKSNKLSKVYILMYVDDLLIFGTEMVSVERRRLIGTLFNTIDLCKCCHFLGLNIDYRNNTVFLWEASYAQRVIENESMKDCKPAAMPLSCCDPFYEEREPETEFERKEMEFVHYRSMLGFLMYISTRKCPDISAAVSMLGKFQVDPAPRHMNALNHVIWDRKGTLSYGVAFTKSSETATIGT